MSKWQRILSHAAGTTTIIAALSISGSLQAQECQIVPGALRIADSAANEGLHALPHGLSESPHTGLHGQILFGLDSLYMVHLPVFMRLSDDHPHNFQVIAEVEFADPTHHERYRADRLAHENEIYTAVPPLFDQTALVIEHEGRKSLRRLPGVRIVRGHFEQGGQSIIDNASLEVVRMVDFRELDPLAERSTTAMYRLYGRDKDLFLTHILSGPPDRDETVRVTLEVTGTIPAVLEDDVERAMEDAVLILGNAGNEPTDRLSEGSELPCLIMPSMPTRALPVEATITVEEELYCEAGELSATVAKKFNTPKRCS